VLTSKGLDGSAETWFAEEKEAAAKKAVKASKVQTKVEESKQEIKSLNKRRRRLLLRKGATHKVSTQRIADLLQESILLSPLEFNALAWRRR
jgi:hypothetical protein